MPPAAQQWLNSPAAIFGAIFLLLLTHHLLDKPAGIEDRVRLLELMQRDSTLRLQVLEEKEIPPAEQIAFNNKISEHVKRLENNIALAEKLGTAIDELLRWLVRQNHRHPWPTYDPESSPQ